MPARTIQIKVASAKGLRRVKWLSKNDVYVIVALSEPENNTILDEQKTHVDMLCGPDPIWNCPMRFDVDSRRHKLTFRVICQRRFFSDEDIGHVVIPVSELHGHRENVAYQLTEANGKLAGKLNLSYKLTAEPFVGPTLRDYCTVVRYVILLAQWICFI